MSSLVGERVRERERNGNITNKQTKRNETKDRKYNIEGELMQDFIVVALGFYQFEISGRIFIYICNNADVNVTKSFFVSIVLDKFALIQIYITSL